MGLMVEPVTAAVAEHDVMSRTVPLRLPLATPASSPRAPRGFFAHYYNPARSLGLDILRIAAALTILTYHGYYFGTLPQLAGNPVTQRIVTFGYLAVDLFFVLSGWLLTRQALAMRVAWHDRSFATFWTRRWLRTLPPYLVGLLAALVIGRQLTGLTLTRHGFFLQTLQPPNLYPISWSLVTEEWFYLGLPFVVILCTLLKNRKVVALLAAGLLAFSVLDRVALLGAHQPWLAVLMTPQARFEGLVIGAGLAALSLRESSIFQILHQWRRPLCAIALAGIAVFLAMADERSWGYRTLGLLVFCLLVGALVPYLSARRWPAGSPVALVVGTTLLSDLTYALYLVHTVVPRLTGLQQSGFLYGALWLASVFATAMVLHLLVERPFLSVRASLARYRRAAAA